MKETKVGQVAFSLAGAADAASVRQKDIELAVHAKMLTARVVNGTPIILSKDLEAWLETQPAWD